jgi:hypothetical protein
MIPGAWRNGPRVAGIAVFITALAAACIMPAAPGFGAGNSVAFRPALSKDDLDGKRFDLISDGGGTVYVWRLKYIADRDIKNVDIFHSAADKRRLLVGFTINEDGAKRLRYFTKKFGVRRLVIFADGRLVGMIPAVPPAFLGDKIVVRWPGTEKELRSFAGKMNAQPPGILSLYIEEIGRYNDVAVDAWVSAYEDVNKFIEAKREESKTGKALVEELREQGS